MHSTVCGVYCFLLQNSGDPLRLQIGALLIQITALNFGDHLCEMPSLSWPLRLLVEKFRILTMAGRLVLA